MPIYTQPGVFVSETLLPSSNIMGTLTANAAGAVVGTFPKGPTALTRVASWFEFTSVFGNLSAAFPATYQVQLFFLNGGSELYVRRLEGTGAVAAAGTLGSTEEGRTSFTFAAKAKGAAGNNLKVVLSRAPVVSGFDIAVFEEHTDGTTPTRLEVFNDVVTTVGSPDYLVDVINAESTYITATRVAAGSYGDPNSSGGSVTFTGGVDGTVSGTNYTADVFAELSGAHRPLVVFLPSVHEDAPSNAGDIYDAAADWASGNYSFVIADTPANIDATGAVDARDDLSSNSSYVAIYWPNVVIADPVSRTRRSMKKVPPGGAIAGLFLKVDTSQGVFKTPAGLPASLSGITGLEKVLTEADITAVYAGGVNAVRNVPGAGVVVMGGKTLSKARQADQNINVRRSLNYLEKSLIDLTQFAVFENNNATLWARISTVCSVFLGDFWRAGGLAGQNEAAAFYVKCDGENNTFPDIQEGVVNIEVGVAVQYPAEFIVIRLSQQAAA